MDEWKVTHSGISLLKEIKAHLLGKYSGRALRWAVEHNHCFVNARVERFGSRRLKAGDRIAIHMPSNTQNAAILYEDEHLLVFNKPPFFSSEQVAKKYGHFLVHRLDRDTTGLLLLAKTLQARIQCEALFRKRKIQKTYLAWVEGTPPEEGVISGKMTIKARYQGGVIWMIAPQGRFSETHWKRLKTERRYSLLQCIPLTGRTHQIRVHLQYIGHPLVADPIYGSKSPLLHSIHRPLLHAFQLGFFHPLIPDKRLDLTAPPPEDFQVMA